MSLSNFALHYRFGNIGQNKYAVLVIGFDRDLYKSVLGVALDKIGYCSFSRKHIIGKNRLLKIRHLLP